MASRLKVSEWIEILNSHKLTTEKVFEVLQTLYSFPGHEAASSQIGAAIGIAGKSDGPVNRRVAAYAKRNAATGNCRVEFTRRVDGSLQYWDFFFSGRRQGGLFFWKLRPELRKALESVGVEKVELSNTP